MRTYKYTAFSAACSLFPKWDDHNARLNRTIQLLVTFNVYRKNPKISDTQKFAVITLKVKQDGFSLE